MAETKKRQTEIQTILELRGKIEELKNIVLEKNAATESLQSEINAMKDTYHSNLESIKQFLAEQSVLLKSIIDNLNPLPKFASKFPIKTQDELDSVESFICAENQEHMVGTVVQFIKNGGFKQNLQSILGQNIILEHNMDGKQGKIPLFRYTKLMAVFLEATHKLGIGEKDCKEQIRHAMKSVKNRYHKASCLKRKHPEENDQEQ